MVTRRSVLAGAVGALAAAGPADAAPRPGSRAPAANPPERTAALVLGGITMPYPYLDRAGWEADESLRFVDGVETWPAEYHPAQAVTVHHTFIPDSDGTPVARVQLIYQVHTVDDGWGDIGYHLLVDEDGRIYEGRVSGGDGLPVFGPPDAAGRRQVNSGGHVYQHNAGNIGVALIGSFQQRQPTAAQRRSAVHLLAGLTRAVGLDPLAAVDYRNPVNGYTRTVGAVSGHADWLATDCPGLAFAPTLGDLRREVAAVAGRRRAAG